MQYKQQSDNKKITRELLLEYLMRVLKMLKTLTFVQSNETISQAQTKTLLLLAEEIVETNDGQESRPDELSLKRQSS